MAATHAENPYEMGQGAARRGCHAVEKERRPGEGAFRENEKNGGTENDCYWQASQVPPLRMASMLQAFFSASV